MTIVIQYSQILFNYAIKNINDQYGSLFLVQMFITNLYKIQYLRLYQKTYDDIIHQ